MNGMNEMKKTSKKSQNSCKNDVFLSDKISKTFEILHNSLDESYNDLVFITNELKNYNQPNEDGSKRER